MQFKNKKKKKKDLPCVKCQRGMHGLNRQIKFNPKGEEMVREVN